MMQSRALVSCFFAGVKWDELGEVGVSGSFFLKTKYCGDGLIDHAEHEARNRQRGKDRDGAKVATLRGR